MSWLLELLLEGIKELCSQFVVDMMEIVTDMFTELLSCDLSLFEELFGVVGELYKNVMVPMGIAILLLICVWQLFKSMFGKAGLASEDPIELVCRSGMCLFLIVAAKPVVNYILNIAGTPYQWVVGTEIEVESFSEYVSVLEGVTGTLGIDSLSISLLMLIMQFVVAWNYFKMLFIIAERYVLLGVFSYTSPLAFSTGGSKASNNILASWSKMFGGQIVLIILNSWCLKMFLSGYGNLMASSYGFTKFFVATLCLIGFCKITFKLDSYMSSLGVNLGRPSTGLGAMGLMMAAGRIFSHVGKGGGSAATGAGAGNSGMSGASTEGQAYGNATNMAEGARGPIPMSAGMDGETADMEHSSNDMFGDAGENTADDGMRQKDFDGVPSEDAGVLEELGMMPAGDMECSADADADGEMSMNAGEMSDFGRDSAEESADGFQPDAVNADMTNPNVMFDGHTGAVSEMGDYPVEEDDFNTDGTEGPGMDLEGGSIDGTGSDGSGLGDGESVYGTGGSGTALSGGGAPGGDTGEQSNAGIISEIGGETATGPMEAYGSGEGEQMAGGVPHNAPGNAGMDGHTETGQMQDMGRYHDFDDTGKGEMPNIDMGSVPSSEKSEREFRSVSREERIREVPKSREDIKKKRGRQRKDKNIK